MKYHSRFMRLILSPFNKEQREVDALKEHPIFREIDSWIKIKSGALDIKSPSKKAMAERYLKIYFREAYSVYRHMCSDYRNAANSTRTIYRTLHEIVSNTNEQALAACVPTLFIEKMNVRFFKHIDILSDTIAMANVAKTYSTEFEQISSIFDMSLLFIQMEAESIEDTINTMNGQLEEVLRGTVYDNTPV